MSDENTQDQRRRSRPLHPLVRCEMLSEDDLIALASQEPAELARGWCLLNSWEWPSWLPSPMTPKERLEVNPNRGTDAMRWIENRIGRRACSREWNRDSMTDDEHEDFWRGVYEGNADAHARYEARLNSECRGGT